MLSLVFFLVRNGKPMPSPSPTARKCFASVFGGHSFSKPVLIPTLSYRRLVCSFLSHIAVILKGRQRYKKSLTKKVHL